MADLIERQVVIDGIVKSCMGTINVVEAEARTIQYVKRIPSAQPEQQWIPCSERLPEVSGRYFVTRGLKAAGAIWNRVYIANFSDLMGLKSHMIFWEGNVGKSDFVELNDVLAWMPLPEPWEGEA